ncbi:MAG: hypothetical protein ACOH13_07320 [Flavobacteriales bacterium]
MRTLPWLSVLVLLPLAASAQQGFMPLSTVVDGPATERLHNPYSFTHSELRPYLREDILPLPEDSLLKSAAIPFLGRWADPTHTLHGGPLVDAIGGFSAGGTDAVKYRAGLGAWLEWNASERFTLQADAQSWNEVLPNYVDSFARANGVMPAEGLAHLDGKTVQHLDWNGSIDYKAGKYFHLTFGKGRNSIGEGYRSLFLSDEAYGYPYFKITTTAWHIRYQNIFALMDDIQSAGGDAREFQKKFTSMHYLSWAVSKRVNIGVFEAIVWQDNDPKYPRGFDLAYANPVIFYRPVEFGLGSPDNALLGLALNVKVGRTGTMLYSQLILDEFLLANVRAGNGWYGNKQGLQLGAVAHDAFCIKGLMVRGEVDYVRPFLYSHIDPRQNYAHYGQPLAHPYGSGFLEAIVQGEWRSGRWLLSNTFSYAVMGRDSTTGPNGSYGNNIFLSERDRTLKDASLDRDFGYYLGQPLRETVVQNELSAGWLLEPKSGLMLELAWTFRTEQTDGMPQLNTNYIRAGISSNLHGRHPFQVVRN